MVLKLLTAGLITALIAGGAVYVGLDDAALDSLREDLRPEPRSVAVEPAPDPAFEPLVAEAAAHEEAPIVELAEAPTPAPRRTLTPPAEPEPVAASDTSKFQILLTEAEKLSIPDARDDAYLNILDVALMDRRFDVAGSIVSELTQPELRDTARQRIGIALARSGQLEAAFAQVEEIEIEPLQDPIRLEIIRSLSQTDNSRR